MVLDVELDDSVLSVLEKIEKKTHIPCDMQRLIYAGKQLVNEDPLNKYNISKDSTLHLLLRLRGGESSKADRASAILELVVEQRADF